MADPNRGGVDLRAVLDHLQLALALEGFDGEAQQRVMHRIVYGMPQGNLPIPLKRYTGVELTISGELMRQDHPAQVPEGVRLGSADILAKLYRRAADVGDPFAYGRILHWDVHLEPAVGPQAFGAYTIRATAEIERRGKPTSVAEMDSAIDKLLQQPRAPRHEGPQT